MNINSSKIPLSETGRFSPLFNNYLKEDKVLEHLFNHAPRIENIPIYFDDDRFQCVNRQLLASIIKQQYEDTINCTVPGNVAELESANAYTVCTGHQLCIFTGPLYFIYKIVSTIKLAKCLKDRYPNKKFVPIYWMASEDHDFDEVATVNMFDKTISWEKEGKSGAVGRLSTVSLKPVLEQVKEIVGESVNGIELLSLFKSAYENNSNLANATRCLVNALFGEHGLLVIDGDNKLLKREFIPFLKSDLLTNNNVADVEDTNKYLINNNLKPQVHPREINTFYLNENVRERIEFNSESTKFVVKNTTISFTETEIINELDAHPERFSPNVVLRPMYQQCILPNVAYVGGPGEIAYWLQFKKMFESNKLVYPMLVPRSFVTLLGTSELKKMSKYGITTNSLFASKDALLTTYLAKSLPSLASEKEIVQKGFSSIIKVVEKVDASLRAAAEGELKKAFNAIEKLESKMIKAEKKKNEVAVAQINRLMQNLLPNNSLQERHENFIPYYLKYGSEFLRQLIELIDPFEFEMLMLELTNESN